MKINVKGLNKKQIALIIAIAVFAVVLIVWGSVSVVNKESPIAVISDVFTNEDALIGSWQGEKAINAYVFKEDGTYESYISTFGIEGTYTVSGREITLSALGSTGNVVYKYKISGDTLTLTLISSNGENRGTSKLPSLPSSVPTR